MPHGIACPTAPPGPLLCPVRRSEVAETAEAVCVCVPSLLWQTHPGLLHSCADDHGAQSSSSVGVSLWAYVFLSFGHTVQCIQIHKKTAKVVPSGCRGSHVPVSVRECQGICTLANTWECPSSARGALAVRRGVSPRCNQLSSDHGERESAPSVASS